MPFISLLLWELQQQQQNTKIASKALAKQLKHILPNLINYNQSTYVKVRLIFDIFRSIDDVLEYTKQSRQSIMK